MHSQTKGIQLNLSDFQQIYAQHPQILKMAEWAASSEPNVKISGLAGSALSLTMAAFFEKTTKNQLIIADDADAAGYVYFDLRQMLGDENVCFFPSSYKSTIRLSRLDNANEILRTEVLNRLANSDRACIIVTYPEALLQKVVSAEGVQQHFIRLRAGEKYDFDILTEKLYDLGFNKVDFVYEPGQFSVRGGILDIFSFSNEMPFRVDFFGDEIDSIRVFDIETQLSKERKTEIDVVPNLHFADGKNLVSFLEYINNQLIITFHNAGFVRERMNSLYNDLLIKANESEQTPNLKNTHITGDEFFEMFRVAQANPRNFKLLEFSNKSYFGTKKEIDFHTHPQPIFHKNFDLISENFKGKLKENYKIYIFSDSEKQTDRIRAIFDDRKENIDFQPVKKTMHEGFVDDDLSLVCYTDHQIFDRFHKYQLKTDNTRAAKVILTLKELNQFQLGDYLVHVDHGIGTFGGLVRTNVNGKMQEMVKMIFQNGDFIFVSIHALHRLAKYKGKDGEPPKISKLGSGAWERLKERTKAKVKDIARDLIQLYARRKQEKGFAYTPDGYLQHELEASFVYEDTPDQLRATNDVKKDMEAELPMDRLVCGDVGFGKTEVAMRAAFKAATDGKQTAVLVPTTVLALQHFNTFKDRFKDFPVSVEYLSRAKSANQARKVLERLEKGEIDIIIGTHKLAGKSVKFKDLGLLIIDEEQKFGVTVKEKLKNLKINVDTLTMTATPIPRTLQFSLMGARDLSVINTPPPNRYPVQTELHTFDEDLIREVIQHEMNRNGQVFFVNNRIQSIYAMEAMIRRIVPGVRVAVGHGQMPADTLEEIIIDFINYEYDVLVCTTIVENGVDIPNANTMIINSAHRFGLSDLHQLRGRVGRSNKKAFCYLIAPEMNDLTVDARRRLQAIETFADLGSGFNIAMQDLDIRGAGNMLGAEQSGFIADLGYETYQKILNEAMTELRNEEFADLYDNEKSLENTTYVDDCQIDTDMEIMFPPDYVENVSERITIYQELDNIADQMQLADFVKRIEDRFGKLPQEAQQLITIVKIRWFAIDYSIERLILKNEKMTAYFVSNMQSPYYQSDKFGKVLQYAAAHPHSIRLREQNGKRSIVFSNVKTVEEAMRIVKEIEEYH
ncbi:transcription-repair-coupling factor [Bacteroidia bacterium]|nr:transcription-repair-coupling factor [Bacteroidia bacterium]